MDHKQLLCVSTPRMYPLSGYFLVIKSYKLGCSKLDRDKFLLFFTQYADSFEESRVDGDLLLQLSEDMLREDIEMRNGILRRRFMRELHNLKRMADYSSCDPTNLNGFLQVQYLI